MLYLFVRYLFLDPLVGFDSLTADMPLTYPLYGYAVFTKVSFAVFVIVDIGDSGTVLVWYEGFEKARNSELGEMLPEYKEAMEAINSRVIDLMLPFKNK